MTYKYFIAFLGLMGSLIIAHHANAQVTLSPGDLIKGSLPAVYYYSNEGTRLVFPTDKTFFTWYANFDNVKTITDEQLASIQLGGNVTYKPGVKLVKITTDPKTYAISAGGILRHITSEALAIELYGADWNAKIDDIPDAFFVNYAIGAPINSSADYNPAQESIDAISIDKDREPQTCTSCNGGTQPEPQTPTSTMPLAASLTVNKNSIQPGDDIDFTVVTDYKKGIKEIRIYFDGSLVTTCDYAPTCFGSKLIDKNTPDGTYEARAQVTAVDNSVFIDTKQIIVSSDSISEKAGITINQSTIRVGQTTTITIEADISINVSTIEIFINDSGTYICASGSLRCSYGYTGTGNIGDVKTVYAIVKDSQGRTYRTADKTITLANNDSPVVTVQGSKPSIYTNETVDITVTASDTDGISYLEILDSGKNLLKHCDGAAPCTFTTAPITQTGTLTFIGRAADMLDLTQEQSVEVQVTNP
ncbi:MAG: hypothetical protein ACOYUZ_01200 [Patescibacteria group bacterium]